MWTSIGFVAFTATDRKERIKCTSRAFLRIIREKGAGAPSDSEKSFFCEAQNFAAGDNQVVEHPNFNELQCIAQPASD